MPKKFSITREEVKKVALSLRGVRFRHQGRNPETGLDCVGFLVELGTRIKYPDLVDLEGYKRVPSANIIRSMMEQNLDEIPVEEVGIGDMFLMRLHGIKPRHVSLMVEDGSDGNKPAIIHANYNGVNINYVSDFPAAWFVAGFRVRGLKV